MRASICILLVLFVTVISCEKDKDPNVILSKEDLLIDTVYYCEVGNEAGNCDHYRIFNYYNDGKLRSVTDKDKENQHGIIRVYSYSENQLQIEELTLDSVLLGISIFYLNDEGYVLNDSSHSIEYQYKNGYLSRRFYINGYVSYTYQIYNGNIEKLSIYSQNFDGYGSYTGTDTNIFSYKYSSIENYINTKHLDQIYPEVYFTGKGTVNLVEEITGDEKNSHSTEKELFSYKFDNKNRIIERTRQCKISGHFFMCQELKITYKN